MTLTLSGDFAVIDGTETVSYYVRSNQAGGFAAPVTIANCLRRVLAKEDRLADGVLSGQAALIWHVWKANAGGVVPKVGDVVQDSSNVRWTVQHVDVATLGSRYKLTCLKER